MKGQILTPALWLVFTLIVLSMGHAALKACDIGWPFLFGRAYCSAPPNKVLGHDENSRKRDLEFRIHEAELKLSVLPKCGTPSLDPQIVPQQPSHAPPPAEDIPLKIPTTLAELDGCWESVKGDIPVVSDDAEQRPEGNIRQCFCFDASGHGRVKQRYTDGSKCGGPIAAEIENHSLKIHQPGFECVRNSGQGYYVPNEIVCHTDDSGAAACDVQSLGRMHTLRKGEQYRRVANDHCG